MTEEEKHTAFVQMMEIMEMCDNLLELTTDVANMPFEIVNREIWEAIRNGMEANAIIVAAYKQSIVHGAKVLDNDAAYAHVMAVMTAD